MPVRHRAPRVAITFALLAGLMLPPVQSAELTYRWTDSAGNHQLSDTLPSGAAARGYQVIDPHTGEVVREIEPRKTAEEKAREAAKEEAAARDERKAHSRAERDRILLSLYGSESDLKTARDERLDRLDARIVQMEGSIDRMQANIDAGHEDPSYARDLKQLKKAIVDARAERDAAAEKFEADLQRLREIRSDG